MTSREVIDKLFQLLEICEAQEEAIRTLDTICADGGFYAQPESVVLHRASLMSDLRESLGLSVLIDSMEGVE